MLIILLPLFASSQDLEKYKYLLDNRILSDNLDLNLKWPEVKRNCNLTRVYFTQKEKNEILLDNILHTYLKSIDTFNTHSVFFKALNEKSKILFGEKFDNLYLDIEIAASIRYKMKSGGAISINFHRKFNSKQESKIFYSKVFNKIENITKSKFIRDTEIKNDDLIYNYLSYNNHFISLFNYGNSILLNFKYHFVDDGWPSEISYNEFSENFKLFDELHFFNGFRFSNSIANYSNILKEVKGQFNDGIRIYQIQNNTFRKKIGLIQFDDGYVLTQNDSIYRQMYLINKNEFNTINSDRYFNYLKILITEFGFGFLDSFSKETKCYYWLGNDVIITFEYNIIDEDYRLIIEVYK